MCIESGNPFCPSESIYRPPFDPADYSAENAISNPVPSFDHNIRVPASDSYSNGVNSRTLIFRPFAGFESPEITVAELNRLF